MGLSDQGQRVFPNFRKQSQIIIRRVADDPANLSEPWSRQSLLRPIVCRGLPDSDQCAVSQTFASPEPVPETRYLPSRENARVETAWEKQESLGRGLAALSGAVVCLSLLVRSLFVLVELPLSNATMVGRIRYTRTELLVKPCLRELARQHMRLLSDVAFTHHLKCKHACHNIQTLLQYDCTGGIMWCHSYIASAVATITVATVVMGMRCATLCGRPAVVPEVPVMVALKLLVLLLGAGRVNARLGLNRQKGGRRSKPKRHQTDRNRNVYANTSPGVGSGSGMGFGPSRSKQYRNQNTKPCGRVPI